MAYYAGYAASISKESPFRLYSQKSFSCELRIPDQSAPVQPKVVLQEHQQQQQQKHHLQQQLQQRVLQHTQSQQQRLNATWSLVWCALLVTAIAGALFAFAPVSYYPAQSFTKPNLAEREAVMAPTAGTIKCHVSQGSSSVSSLCDGDLQFAGGVQQHITIWRQAAVTGAPVQSAASARLDDGSSSSNPWDVYGRRRRQQHRKLMRLTTPQKSVLTS